MPSLARLLGLAALAVSASAIIPPGHQGALNQTVNVSENDTPTTDNESIVNTIGQVNQKSGAATHSTPPSAPVPPTTVTALDSSLTNTTLTDVASNSTAPSSRRRRSRPAKRFADDDLLPAKRQQSSYTQVFSGLAPGVHDASIEGTAYLTYTVVPNSTYNVDACLDWCDTVEDCVFVNLYYEFNDYLLDFVFSQQSNLVCAAYSDIHNATEKINFGGQTSYPQVGNETVPLTYITQSSGWAADSLTEPEDPDGYTLVFGPTGGANNAPGYMGFAFLSFYDVDGCAALCNGRGADPVGGGCSYFNIWRAVVDGTPTTYTCSMYYLVANETTAVNYGQGDLVVTYSRGYSRNNLVIDGGFEGYNACDDFCLTESYANWIGSSPSGGDYDASIIHFQDYAHFGQSSALLGAAFGDDADAGTLTPAQKLKTVAGQTYVVQVFFSSSFSSEELEGPAKVDILWNGKRVGGTSGFVASYTFTQSDTVVGTGSDVLSFVGGAAPAWTFVDDVKVFEV
ncbi:hypothetical protein HMN09_01291200 [Mycena chlorophos]|uniref:Fruit-body specific protein a n=1 Tax=Mycena chlorophos TaxID=658473 RepID=A0A8H6S0R7_MYCCL|nr:hypothetical protein HMN09_01291200 [Mycena chlorophos]